MTASEKIVYLRGLAEGLGIDGTGKEGKLMLAMLDVMDIMAQDIEAVEAKLSDMADTIDDIGEDMAYLEDLAIGRIEDGDEGELVCSGDCASCGGCPSESEDAPKPAEAKPEADYEVEYEVTCPACGETVTVYEDDLAFGSIACPVCGEELEFDLDEE